MTGPIAPISAPPALDSIQPAGSPAAGGGFQDVFSAAIKSVEASGQDASASIGRFLSGEGEDVHTTVLAAERAAIRVKIAKETDLTDAERRRVAELRRRQRSWNPIARSLA